MVHQEDQSIKEATHRGMIKIAELEREKMALDQRKSSWTKIMNFRQHLLNLVQEVQGTIMKLGRNYSIIEAHPNLAQKIQNARNWMSQTSDQLRKGQQQQGQEQQQIGAGLLVDNVTMQKETMLCSAMKSLLQQKAELSVQQKIFEEMQRRHQLQAETAMQDLYLQETKNEMLFEARMGQIRANEKSLGQAQMKQAQTYQLKEADLNAKSAKLQQREQALLSDRRALLKERKVLEEKYKVELEKRLQSQNQGEMNGLSVSKSVQTKHRVAETSISCSEVDRDDKTVQVQHSKHEASEALGYQRGTSPFNTRISNHFTFSELCKEETFGKMLQTFASDQYIS